MNFIQVAGHLGGDPETRFTSNGQKVTSFRIATNIRRKSGEITVWYRITVWGDRLDYIVQHLRKGSGVIILGELQKPEIFTGRDGQPQINLEVWAEMIRFNPFGRSDKNEQQTSPGTQSEQPHRVKEETRSGYEGAADPMQDFSSAYSYSPTTPGSFVSAANDNHEDEDTIPF